MYQMGTTWFVCDRCSQKRRRPRQFNKQWDGAVVCNTCLDPRPPEMTAPNSFPEGLALPDSRPPQES